MNQNDELIFRCLKKDVRAQEQFYRRFAPRLYGICLRYAGNTMEAEDMLQEGFIRIFTNLHRYRSEGSLEGWLRRIIVNTAINYYRRNLRYRYETELKETTAVATLSEEALSKISKEELLKVVQSLPIGYRTVFNLYVMEGYTHKEIGEILGISENTSKSQLSRARGVLQEILTRQMNITTYGGRIPG